MNFNCPGLDFKVYKVHKVHKVHKVCGLPVVGPWGWGWLGARAELGARLGGRCITSINFMNFNNLHEA